MEAPISGLTYKDAGVDIDAGNRLVDVIKPLAKATMRPGVMDQLGGFGAFFDPKAAGFKDPVLVEPSLHWGSGIRISQMHPAQLPDLFAPGEVILTPSAVGEAPLGLHSTGNSVFNRTWTALHVPCLTVPVTDGPHGLPLGVQFVDPRRDEATLLGTARWAAQALGLPVFG